MIEEIIEKSLEKSEKDINNIKDNKVIDCITIFSISDEEYNILNKELANNRIIDKMLSGNLYLLNKPLKTIYGNLSFIKIRKIKEYDTFELIQFKKDSCIINIISLSAKDDYKI